MSMRIESLQTDMSYIYAYRLIRHPGPFYAFQNRFPVGFFADDALDVTKADISCFGLLRLVAGSRYERSWFCYPSSADLTQSLVLSLRVFVGIIFNFRVTGDLRQPCCISRMMCAPPLISYRNRIDSEMQ